MVVYPSSGGVLKPPGTYRGRLAPSPTGYLHLGHARTFWVAQERAKAGHGTLILRNEDLDQSRSRPEFVTAMLEDLRWFGLDWSEGPDIGGPFAPYSQSERQNFYEGAFERLKSSGAIYPCTCSRQDVLRAAAAPHPGEDEPIYPGTCRSNTGGLDATGAVELTGVFAATSRGSSSTRAQPICSCSATIARSTCCEETAAATAQVTSQTDWPTYNGQPSGNRYSTLTQIDKANVVAAGAAVGVHAAQRRSCRSTPVVVDGVMYVTQRQRVLRARRRQRAPDLALPAPAHARGWSATPAGGVESRRRGRRRPRVHGHRPRAPHRAQPLHRRAAVGNRDGRLAPELQRHRRAAGRSATW